MIKKITVTEYKPDGEMTLKTTIGLRGGIHANDFAQAKKLVAQVVQLDVLSKTKFTVEWKRDGYSEGYMVHR